MAVIRPALESDLKAISEYLPSRLGGRGGPPRYRRFFEYPWFPERPNLGFLIENEGKIGGFIGAIYARRIVRGKEHVVCNINSWSVDEAYRKQSLMLIKSLLNQPGRTFTCFSPSQPVTEVLTFFKFKTWPVEKVLITPINGLGAAIRSPRVRVLSPGNGLEQELDSAERRIYDDHRGYRCGHTLLIRGDQRSYVITVRRGRDARAFADVLYASDPALLAECVAYTHLPLLRAHGTLITGIDRRWLPRLPAAAYVYRGLRPIQYRSPDLELNDIDTAYSELVPMYG